VQETFIRWMKADRSDVREPEAFLRRMVTRLCLDQLKSARRRGRPILDPGFPTVVEEDEVEDVTLPLMLVLERLSPLERAAFLLHDVFGLGSRRSRPPSSATRWPVASSLPRAHPCPSGETPLQGGKAAWARACRGVFRRLARGDMKTFGAMLAADVSLHADGGGKRPAATEPIFGFDAVMKVHEYWRVFSGRRVRTCSCRFCQRIAGFHHARGRW